MPHGQRRICAQSLNKDIELDTYAADAKGISWMQDVIQDQEQEIEIEDNEDVRKNEAFLFRRTTDDDSISPLTIEKEREMK